MRTIKQMIQKIKSGMYKEMWEEIRWICGYARRYRAAIVFYAISGLVSALISLLSSLISRDMVDIITGQQTGRLTRTFALMIGCAVGSLLLNQTLNYISSWINIRVDNEIKAEIFSKILAADWESMSRYHTGDLLTRWNSDVTNISGGALNFIPNLIIYMFRFISAFAVVVYHDPTFAVFALLGVPVTMVMSRATMRRMRSNNRQSAEMSAKMNGFNQEAFSNIQTIKAFGLNSRYNEKLCGLQSDYLHMKLEFQKMSMLTSVIMGVTGFLVSYSSYGWGIYRVWSGVISYGTMTMFLGLSSALTGALNNLISLVPTGVSLTTSARRLMELLELPRENDSGEEEAALFLQQYKDNGVSLQLDDVSYAYQNGSQVFKHLTMEAHPHEIIALIGSSGEGKTTLLRLLLSLLQPQAGKAALCADSPHTAALTLTPASRRCFSYVPQGNTMFSGTIAENMRDVKPDASEDEIARALRQACAWEFVSRLPLGIHTVLRERGGGLSEGQAQRLSIARALLRNAPILLLDEATSALDKKTEKQVLQNIIQDACPRTCILVTHRLSPLRICSRVYHLEAQTCRMLLPDEIEQMINAESSFG